MRLRSSPIAAAIPILPPIIGAISSTVAPKNTVSC